MRVRVLLDDLQAAGQDTLLAGFAARPNVELRLFNPLPVREGSVGARVLFSAHQFSRINRRMHNKLFIADSSFAISGGRNIGYDYFGRSGPVNFIDMDVLSAGPVVRELAAVFDAYWNSRHAYPIEALALQNGTPEAGRRNFDAHVRPARATGRPVTARDPLDQSSVGDQLAAGQVALHLATVRVLADPPQKVDDAAAAPADGPVMEGQLALMQEAHAEVLIASPYFVPGRRTLDVLQRATGEQVRVSVITNSLATTDEPLVHFGYARYRTALLDMGVALYELMPDDDDVDAHAAADGPRGSLGRLHAKLAVVDGRGVRPVQSSPRGRRTSRSRPAAPRASPGSLGHSRGWGRGRPRRVDRGFLGSWPARSARTSSPQEDADPDGRDQPQPAMNQQHAREARSAPIVGIGRRIRVVDREQLHHRPHDEEDAHDDAKCYHDPSHGSSV